MREPHYRKVADLTLDCGAETPEQLRDRIPATPSDSPLGTLPPRQTLEAPPNRPILVTENRAVEQSGSSSGS